MTNVIANKQEYKIEDYVWNTLKNSMYPGAKDESIKMVLDYCKAFQIDPMQKAVHIFPMSVRNAKTNNYEWKDTIIPGISLYRIQASRTNQFVGLSEPEYGEIITKTLGSVEISYPEWCKITVKRMVQGVISEFTSKEYWTENYAKKNKGVLAPNTMWEKRPFGQLAKCTEAQSLRKAFPELLGQQYTFEEMEGKMHEKEVMESKAETLSQRIDKLLPKEKTLEIKEDKQEELLKLIEKHHVSDDTIGKWCNKAGVNTVAELDEDKVQSCIEYIVGKSDNVNEILV
jgi:phage recombination protein Bet